MSQTQSPTSELVAGAAAGESREWNWHPSLPIETSPVFKALPRPFASLKWYADAWLPLSELALYVLLAWAVWAWVQPDPLATQALAPGWIAAVWLRNIALMTVFATFLHLWLYTWKKQGDALRYDRRGPTATARVFAFGSQLWDNVAYALISGVTIWTLYEVGLPHLWSTHTYQREELQNDSSSWTKFKLFFFSIRPSVAQQHPGPIPQSRTTSNLRKIQLKRPRPCRHSHNSHSQYIYT